MLKNFCTYFVNNGVLERDSVFMYRSIVNPMAYNVPFIFSNFIFCDINVETDKQAKPKTHYKLYRMDIITSFLSMYI